MKHNPQHSDTTASHRLADVAARPSRRNSNDDTRRAYLRSVVAASWHNSRAKQGQDSGSDTDKQRFLGPMGDI